MKEEFFVLMYPDGKPVALDDASGGYPCPVSSFTRAERFRTAEAADHYRQVGNNPEGFTIHKATLTVTTEPVEV